MGKTGFTQKQSVSIKVPKNLHFPRQLKKKKDTKVIKKAIEDELLKILIIKFGLFIGFLIILVILIRR
jgi:hypothetical protein